jgi:hypothetical protein
MKCSSLQLISKRPNFLQNLLAASAGATIRQRQDKRKLLRFAAAASGASPVASMDNGHGIPPYIRSGCLRDAPRARAGKRNKIE